MNVTLIHQLPGLCGAACAQMILNAQPGTGIGTTEADQKGLWKEIKQLTRTPDDVKQIVGTADDSACQNFERRICECRRNPFCWCTFPTALQAILLQHAPTLNTQVIVSGSEVSIIEEMASCFEAGVPPAVLVHHGRHWVVVEGFGADGVSFDVLDPEFYAEKNVTKSAWRAKYLKEVTCGKYAGQHVIVGTNA